MTEKSILQPGNAFQEKYKDGNETGRHVSSTGKKITKNIIPIAGAM